MDALIISLCIRDTGENLSVKCLSQFVTGFQQIEKACCLYSSLYPSGLKNKNTFGILSHASSGNVYNLILKLVHAKYLSIELRHLTETVDVASLLAQSCVRLSAEAKHDLSEGFCSSRPVEISCVPHYRFEKCNSQLPLLRVDKRGHFEFPNLTLLSNDNDIKVELTSSKVN